MRELKMNLDRLLNVAVEAAKEGGVGHRTRSFRVGAVLFDKKKRILDVRPNSMKTHPFLKRITPFPFLHAEAHCILSHGINNCEGLDLLVCRINKDGSLNMACPCEVCRTLIKMAKIRNVYYTDWNGDIQLLEEGTFIEKRPRRLYQHMQEEAYVF